MCVYTVITNGFSSVYCACTIIKSRGCIGRRDTPCHFLCQRSWVTCGKDIDQGRLIYVPAIVSTVDFLFLFMSCALFLRSRIRVRWKSTARQLRKSGDDYDIIHTFYSPLPHSVCITPPALSKEAWEWISFKPTMPQCWLMLPHFMSILVNQPRQSTCMFYKHSALPFFSAMWATQCHKPTIWAWLTSNPFMVILGDLLWHWVYHIMNHRGSNQK